MRPLRLRRSFLALLLLGSALPAEAKPRATPKPPREAPDFTRVDTQAMHEAMSRPRDEHYASARAYALWLRARLAALDEQPAEAIEALQQAQVHDPDSIEVRVALAEELARAGKVPAAEEELKRAIARAPLAAEPLKLLGRLALIAGTPARAVAPLGRALQLAPADALAVMLLGQSHLELGHEDAAVQVMERWALAAPTEHEPLKWLGAALAERGQVKRAERLFKQARSRAPLDAELLTSLAKLLADQGRLIEAAAEYERAIAADPDQPETLLAAAEVALSRRELPLARGYLDQFLALKPDDADALLRASMAWLGAGEMTPALSLLLEARAVAPADPRIAFFAGRVLSEGGRHREAVAAFGDVPSTHELGGEAGLHLALALSRLGEHDAALERLERTLAAHPEMQALRRVRVELLTSAGRTREARAALEAGWPADRNPGVEWWLTRVEVLVATGSLEEAVSAGRDALIQNPRETRLWHGLAMLHERAGRPELALQLMRERLQGAPDDASALNFVAWSQAEKGKGLDEAEKLARRAVELVPASGAYLDTLGWVLFKRGDMRPAVEALTRAEHLSPLEPAIAEHLGDALVSARRPREGEAAYRRALVLLPTPADEARRNDIQRKLEKLGARP